MTCSCDRLCCVPDLSVVELSTYESRLTNIIFYIFDDSVARVTSQFQKVSLRNTDGEDEWATVLLLLLHPMAKQVIRV